MGGKPTDTRTKRKLHGQRMDRWTEIEGLPTRELGSTGLRMLATRFVLCSPLKRTRTEKQRTQVKDTEGFLDFPKTQYYPEHKGKGNYGIEQGAQKKSPNRELSLIFQRHLARSSGPLNQQEKQVDDIHFAPPKEPWQTIVCWNLWGNHEFQGSLCP